MNITAATYNPTVDQSGTTFFLKRAAGTAVLLPAVSAGVWYKFVVGIDHTGDSTITSTSDGTTPSNLISGPTYASDGNAAATGAVEDVITVANAADVIGDWVELLSDGVRWYVSGGAAVATGVTIA